VSTPNDGKEVEPQDGYLGISRSWGGDAMTTAYYCGRPVKLDDSALKANEVFC
jgi:hypothetical protein